MPEHHCQCWRCSPDRYPVAPEHETIAYAAIQVDGQRPVPDWVRTKQGQMSNRRVFIDGVECTQGVFSAFEAMAGDPGWVIGFPHDPVMPSFHYCRKHLTDPEIPMTECAEVRRGVVTMEWVNG